jgi:hypothetical protein
VTRKNAFIVSAAAVMLAVFTAWPTEAVAQQRRVSPQGRGGSGTPGVAQGQARPRTGPATGQASQRPPGRYPAGSYRSNYRYYTPYYRGYYSPYYSSWGPSFGWGWGSWYGWGYPSYGYYGYGQYGYPPFYYPRYRYFEPGVDLRLEVKPRDAEVYLDGYLVGTVDDFDGVFQRLRVPYGEHEVTIYFQGYQTIRQKMLFRPGESYRIQEVMQPVAPGEQPEPRPTPSPDAATTDERGRPPLGRVGEPPMRPGEEPPMPPAPGLEARGDFGTLAIRVQPADAEILIDGEKWESPAGESRLTVELSEGTHHIEIRKDGHKPYSADVPIRRGRTASLNVSLPKGD